MYDYESKEEVTSSPPRAGTKSISATFDFINLSNSRRSEIDMNKLNNTLLLTTTTNTISEDMKSNDANYHGCESSAAVPSTSSSSLLSSQAEESIDTPIISNRPIHREAPPLLCLPPSLSAQNRVSFEDCTDTAKMNHQLLSTAKHVHSGITVIKKKSPRFSSFNDAPIIMTGAALDDWRGKQKKSSSDRNSVKILSERLPAMVELVQFSNNSGNGAAPVTLTSDIIRCSLESIVKMGVHITMNRIKRTLFESNVSELQQRQNIVNSINIHTIPSAASSNKHLQQKIIYGRTVAKSTDLEPDHASNTMLHDAKKLRRLNNLLSVISPKRTVISPISAVGATDIRSNRKVVGIRNYGQTCFLNSVVQALASLDPFISYLERIVQLNVKHRNYLRMARASSCLSALDDDDYETNFADSYNGRIAHSRNNITTQSSSPRSGDHSINSLFCEEMLNLLKSVNGENQASSHRQLIDPRPVLLTVGRKHKQFQRRFGGVGVAAIGEQQDAQELLQAVLGMIIDECQFNLAPPAIPSPIMSSFATNSNDADMEGEGNPMDPLGEDSVFLYGKIDMNSTSKAMEIMMTTTSAISPCPLSVWCGSALMCSTCHRVRPIQNVPFLDIPIIPTSISRQMMYSPTKGQDVPSCRLEDCLSEFTAIERVFDVECKNCTIKAEIQEKICDREFQLQIIDGIRSRQSKINAKLSQNGDSTDNSQTNHVLDDLRTIEAQLEYLSRLSPDDDNPLYKGTTSTTTIVGLEETATTPARIRLKRSDAFKCLLLTRLPSILSIHVQRRYFDPNAGKSSKTMQHIDFPEMLDVSSFCAYGAPRRNHSSFSGTVSVNQSNDLNAAATSMPIWYKLMAVIEHRGGPYAGHYICFRRDPTAGQEDRWLWISDDTVRLCQWSNVRNCQAYMLFYEAT